MTRERQPHTLASRIAGTVSLQETEHTILDIVKIKMILLFLYSNSISEFTGLFQSKWKKIQSRQRKKTPS